MAPTETSSQGAAHGDAIPLIDSIHKVGADRQAWLVDVWGVMHNGVVPFKAAVDACARFRASGGFVVLVTNAPRPSASVVEQLDRIGVSRAAYDAIVTSGDVTRGLIHHWRDKKIHHLGPDRDLPLFADLAKPFVTSNEAEIVVCTGLHNDETETPDDYRLLLDRFKRHNAAMICANPDLKVERGDRIVHCAGALAAAYEAIGGEVVYAGKPHGPIYELARSIVAQGVGGNVNDTQLLAIGDGIHTDIAGAAEAGIDAVYIASGIHLAPDALTLETLRGAFAELAAKPIAGMRHLHWSRLG